MGERTWDFLALARRVSAYSQCPGGHTGMGVLRTLSSESPWRESKSYKCKNKHLRPHSVGVTSLKIRHKTDSPGLTDGIRNLPGLCPLRQALPTKTDLGVAASSLTRSSPARDEGSASSTKLCRQQQALWRPMSSTSQAGMCKGQQSLPAVSGSKSSEELGKAVPTVMRSEHALLGSTSPANLTGGRASLADSEAHCA